MKLPQESPVCIDRVSYGEENNPTLACIIQRYELEWLPQKRSQRSPKQQLRFWARRLGQHPLKSITPRQLAEVKQELMTKVSGSTVNRYLAILSHVFSVAIKEWFLLESNPVLRISRAKENRSRVRFLSEAERKRLLKALEKSPKSLQVIVKLAIYTGMRAGEILTLRWSQIDLARALIQLPLTKSGRPRSVVLVGPALEALQAWKPKGALKDRLVFPGKNPARPLDFRSAWRTASKAAKLQNFRFHDLRHTAASYLAMSGASPQEIAEVLGHSSLAMVARYAHLAEGHTRKALERMADQFKEGSS